MSKDQTIEDIKRRLEIHWELTKEEREKTHTNKMYQKHLDDKT